MPPALLSEEEHSLSRSTSPRSERRRHPASRYAFALLAAVAAALATAAMGDLMQRSPFILSLIAVLGAALYGGFGPALLAGLTSAVVGAYLVVPPTGSFWIAAGSDLAGLGVLILASGVAVGVRGWRRAVPPSGRRRAERRVAGGERSGAAGEDQRQRTRDRILAALGFAASRVLETPDQHHLVDALGALGRATGVSRVYVFENGDGPDGELVANQTHEWVAPGIEPQREHPELQLVPYRAAGFGRWADSLSRGQSIGGAVEDFPPSERPLLESQGIRSLMVVPIFLGTEWWGFIGFDDCERARDWSVAEVEGLGIAARFIGASIQHRRTSEAVRRSEARFRALVENVSDAIMTLDERGRILYANSTMERITGRAVDAWIGRSPAELVHPADYDRALAGFAETRRNPGADVSMELRIRHLDGTWRWVEITSKNLVADPALEGISCVCRDITERRQAEQRERALVREQVAREAAEAEERRSSFLAEASRVLASSLDYETTLQSVARLAVPVLADWCFVDLVDGDGTLRRVATAHVDPDKERLTRELLRYWSGPDEPSVSTRILHSGKPWWTAEVSDREIERASHNVEHLRILRALQVGSAMGVPLVARGRRLGVVRMAITESDRRFGPDDVPLVEELASRAALAIDNARLYEEARMAVRIRDDVLDAVSHDLRSPLSIIAMSTGVLRAHPTVEDEPRLRRSIETIRLATHQMRRLMRDLVDVAAIEAGQLSIEPAPLEVAPLLVEACEMFRALADRKSQELERDVTAEHLLIRADRDRVLQVLGNLVSNAIKFTSEGGRITVRAEASGDWVRFSVADTGPGIQAKHIPRIFDRFWKAERRGREGAGLGLAICKGIVAAHGGHVWVESDVGEGTAFHFVLPAVHARV